jgi:hypothetical protein
MLAASRWSAWATSRRVCRGHFGLRLVAGRLGALQLVERFVARFTVDHPALDELLDPLVLRKPALKIGPGPHASRFRLLDAGLGGGQVGVGRGMRAVGLLHFGLGLADTRGLPAILGLHLGDVQTGQHLSFAHAVVHIHEHLGDIAGDARENRRPLDGLNLARLLDRDRQGLPHRPTRGHGRWRLRRGRRLAAGLAATGRQQRQAAGHDRQAYDRQGMPANRPDAGIKPE